MPIDPVVVAWSKVVEFNGSSVGHNKHVTENPRLGRDTLRQLGFGRPRQPL
jgi:hypothetical protein